MNRLTAHLAAFAVGLGVVFVAVAFTTGPIHVYGPTAALAVMAAPLLATSALAGLLTPRPGRDVPHRPDRPRVEGSARTGARPEFLPRVHGTRPINVPARRDPRVVTPQPTVTPGRATVRT